MCPHSLPELIQKKHSALGETTARHEFRQCSQLCHSCFRWLTFLQLLSIFAALHWLCYFPFHIIALFFCRSYYVEVRGCSCLLVCGQGRFPFDKTSPRPLIRFGEGKREKKWKGEWRERECGERKSRQRRDGDGKVGERKRWKKERYRVFLQAPRSADAASTHQFAVTMGTVGSFLGFKTVDRFSKSSCRQWRRLHRARGDTCPHFYKWLGTGGTVSRRTANKKLTKLYWPSRKRSPQPTNCTFRAEKVEGHDQNFLPALCAKSVPPIFAPDRCPPLLNSFRRHGCRRCAQKYIWAIKCNMCVCEIKLVLIILSFLLVRCAGHKA